VQLTPLPTHTGHLGKKINKGTIFFGHLYIGQKLETKSKQVLYSITFFLKILPVRRHVEKYGRATSTTGDNVI
jgi:hypothetical protein